MVYDAVRGYLQLAMGLTEVTKQKANDAAKAVAGQLGIQGEDALAGAGVAAGIASQQVQTLAEDLLAAARSNRKLLTDLVRVEVDAVVNRLGITDQKQVEAVRATLAKLEEQLAGLVGIRRTPSEPAAPKSKSSAGGARPLVTEPAKKTTAKKTTSKKTAAKKTTAKKATAAKKTTAKKTTAAKRTTAKKVAAPAVADVTPNVTPDLVDAVEYRPEVVVDPTPELLVETPAETSNDAPVIVLRTIDDEAALGSSPEQS